MTGTIFFTIFLIFMVYLLVQNKRTLNQRLKILDAMRKTIGTTDKNYFHYSPMFDEVSYNKHWFSLVTFRNPNKRYNSELIELLED